MIRPGRWTSQQFRNSPFMSIVAQLFGLILIASGLVAIFRRRARGSPEFETEREYQGRSAVMNDEHALHDRRIGSPAQPPCLIRRVCWNSDDSVSFFRLDGRDRSVAGSRLRRCPPSGAALARRRVHIAAQRTWAGWTDCRADREALRARLPECVASSGGRADIGDVHRIWGDALFTVRAVLP